MSTLTITQKDLDKSPHCFLKKFIINLNNFFTFRLFSAISLCMTYSIDLRKKVVSFVRGGGSKVEAAKIFNISRQVLYNWLSCGDDLSSKQKGVRRFRKINHDLLAKDVALHPDSLLKERAARFGVHMSSMAYALKQLGVSRKKNLQIF